MEKFMKILIVEDDPHITKLITNMLSNWGYDTNSASTGKEALKLFSKNNYDLILLDIMLPDYIGYELIPKFKNINAIIKIITMTGHSSRDLEQKVREQI